MTGQPITIPRGERAEPAPRRYHESFPFEHAGFKYRASIGRNAIVDGDGRLAGAGPVVEIFLNAGKEGGLLTVLAHDQAILTSLLLQYGCPIDDIRRALLRNSNGTAAGPVGVLLDQLAAEECEHQAEHRAEHQAAAVVFHNGRPIGCGQADGDAEQLAAAIAEQLGQLDQVEGG